MQAKIDIIAIHTPHSIVQNIVIMPPTTPAKQQKTIVSTKPGNLKESFNTSIEIAIVSKI
jgi:hypothetical protein